MEMSCDEAVIKQLGSDVKKEYSSSLLTLATGRRIIGGSPLAFGEGDTKGRIKNVLNYKKPAFWVVIASFVIVVALAMSLLTNPKQTPINLSAKDEVFSMQIEQVNEGESLGVVQITEASDIETILMALQNTNKTLKKSYNDAPSKKDYFRIYIEGTSLQRLFLYNDNGRYYIEEPYVGFYKTNRETSVSIAKVYTSNGGVYSENSVSALWNARTKYIGDNSAVSKLIGLLPVPEGLQYDHFKLHTSERPYNIEIVYSVPPEELKKYDTESTPVVDIFRKNSLLLLALVDNAEGIRAVLTDGKREVGFINGREWADYTVGGDVRNYADSPEKLQELILFKVSPLVDYPEGYSPEQKNVNNAHLRIDKAEVVEIQSKNSILVKIKNELEHEKDEYTFTNGDIVSIIYSEENQRAIDFIRKLHVGSIVNISRYNTTKPKNATPYMTLECSGIDIYDDKGENIVEFF